MQERFRAQLKEFQEDDEARWKYEADEIQRQLRILKRMGQTDEQVKEELKRAGINVSVLEEESAKEAEQLKRAHDEIRQVKPPPARRGGKEQIMMQQVAALAGSHTWLFPPAWEGWGNTEACGFNLGLGEFNLESHQTGEGWGWEATASGPPQVCTLWFYYFPARAGNLLVEPHVDFQGDVAVTAHDHWYTSTHAELRLKLHFDLFQHYWDGELVTPIVDEHRHDSSSAFWVDDHRIVSKSLSVSANDIVWIKLSTSLHVNAHSSHAHVDCNFRTGADRRIRVEHIWVNLT